MNLLYLGYWSVKDGLSEATIRPHLKALSSIDKVYTMTYVSIERKNSHVSCEWNIPKMEFIPHYSPPRPFLIDKIFDFIRIPKQLIQICKDKNINKIICRSSLAGAIGYLIWKKTKIPYYVESFEPHAEYMLESKVWKKWDFRYWLQKYFEKKQKRTASALITVSNNYRKYLKKVEKLKCPVEVIPCTVEKERFIFNTNEREVIRKQFSLDDHRTVGVYVGKFGGLYYELETYQFFKYCFDTIEGFFLIILSTDASYNVIGKLKTHNIPINNCWIEKVTHDEVSSFLSASDFAICPVKSTPNRKFCSPIKNGEYWANGLPIIISDGIGDDSEIIKCTGKGGLIIDFSNTTQKVNCFEEILEIVERCNRNRKDNECVLLAKQHRDQSIIKEIYLRNYL